MKRLHAYCAPLAVFAVVLLATLPLRADNLVADLSDSGIAITSNFTGRQLVLFGAIDRSATALSGTLDEGGARDIIVVIRGPDRPTSVRRKARVAGIWANVENVDFKGVPGYFFVAANRDFNDVAPPSLYRRLQARAATLNMTPKDVTLDAEEFAVFKQAIIRNKMNQGLYYEQSDGVRFLDPTLFRADVTIPANVPVGIYKAEVYLVQDGRVVSVQSKSLEINKSGMERTIYEFAYDSPLAYGFIAVLFALAAGWAASVALQER